MVEAVWCLGGGEKSTLPPKDVELKLNVLSVDAVQ